MSLLWCSWTCCQKGSSGHLIFPLCLTDTAQQVDPRELLTLSQTHQQHIWFPQTQSKTHDEGPPARAREGALCSNPGSPLPGGSALRHPQTLGMALTGQLLPFPCLQGSDGRAQAVLILSFLGRVKEEKRHGEGTHEQTNANNSRGVSGQILHFTHQHPSVHKFQLLICTNLDKAYHGGVNCLTTPVLSENTEADSCTFGITPITIHHHHLTCACSERRDAHACTISHPRNYASDQFTVTERSSLQTPPPHTHIYTEHK